MADNVTPTRVVTTDEATKFLEVAVRNWGHVAFDESGLEDVRDQLERFVNKRIDTQAAEIDKLKADNLDVHSNNDRLGAVCWNKDQETVLLRAGLEQAANNLHVAAKLHQCPGAHKAEQLAREILEVKP